MTARPRVLAIAEAANPEWVSVPLVGWSLAQALRGVADVHLVTHVRNRDAILRAGLEEGRDFTAIDSEAVARPLWKIAQILRGGAGKGWTTQQAIASLAYPYFEHLVWKAFKDRIAGGAFDLVHRITPLTPTMASAIAPKVRRAGVPFVLGPLNGGVPWPADFDAERRREKEWLSYVRGAYKALPGRGRTLAASSAILAGSRHTRSEIPDAHQGRCVWLPENAVDPARFPTLQTRPATGPLRGCFVGRLVPYKGPDMLLEAAAPLLRDGRMTLDMVGDGPMLADLRAFADREGIAGAVTFHGWVEHRAVAGILGAAHALTFPSIREFGGGVVLEAMALGVAPAIVDYAGPGELVTGGVGRSVPIGPRARIVGNFSALLEEMAVDLPGVLAMGEAARARVEAKFTWARKAEQVAQVYDWVLGRRADKPEPV